MKKNGDKNWPRQVSEGKKPKVVGGAGVNTVPSGHYPLSLLSKLSSWQIVDPKTSSIHE